jgi:hypothetical protein
MAMRRWVPIVLGVLAVFVLAIVALAGSCAYMVHKQVQVRVSASAADYEREAASILKRFEGVPALVVEGPSGPRLSSKALAIRHKRGGAINNLHILVFSADENKLVRLTLPMWLLRMSPDGRMDINRDEVGLDNIRLSIADLEAAGPGPLFVRKGNDSRVLVWAE